MALAKRKGDTAFSVFFLSPAFVIYTIFVISAIGLSLYYTTLHWKGLGDKVFVGLQNYVDLVKDPEYWQVAKNSFTLVLLALFIQNPVGLLLAYLITRVKFGFRVIRSLIFLPVVIAAASTALMFQLLLNDDIGIFNSLLRFIGLGFLQRVWLSDPKVVIFAVGLPQVWQYLGIQFIIFLAAIQSIPQEIIESARMDGATGLTFIGRILIPLLWETIQICIILTVTGSLKAFDMSWIMTWGGPGISSAYISVLMYRYAFKGFNFSYGTTIAMTILIYSVVFTFVFKKVFGKKGVLY
jgi:raffinose/stachyose/melibiose transport system permease protein